MSDATTGPARVAVYIDFDNVVISRYDQLHGTGRNEGWHRDNARDHTPDENSDDPVDVRLAEARVDVGAMLDYASSFGTVAIARAYADWSQPANAAYRRQLVDRAVDLTQLFPVSGTKNGADIRLAVDLVEDLLHYTDLTHVVIVGGDSDYIAVAQRAKQLGRYVVGIGVAGSTSRALIAACDEFSGYGDLPGVTMPKLTTKKQPAKKAPDAVFDAPDSAADDATDGGAAESGSGRRGSRGRGKGGAKTTSSEPVVEPDSEAQRQQDATNLLLRAIRNAKSDDEWLFGGGLKSQMQRMDSSFKEKALGYRSFKDFLESRSDVIEIMVEDSHHIRVRLKS